MDRANHKSAFRDIESRRQGAIPVFSESIPKKKHYESPQPVQRRTSIELSASSEDFSKDSPQSLEVKDVPLQPPRVTPLEAPKRESRVMQDPLKATLSKASSARTSSELSRLREFQRDNIQPLSYENNSGVRRTGQPEMTVSPPPMTPRLMNAFDLQRSLERIENDPSLQDFGSLGCSRATYNRTRASFINDSLTSMKNPYDVDHEIVNVKRNLTKGYSTKHPEEDVSLFEEDLMEGETIISEIRVITGAQPFSYSRGFYEKICNLMTCGLRQLLSIKFEHFLWMKNGDSHQQRLAITSKNRILLWTSHIVGTATCACCWSVPVLDHFLVSNTTLQTFDLEDVAMVQQKSVNQTSCWPFQTLRLKIGFKSFAQRGQQLDPFGYVKSFNSQPSSTDSVSDKFELLKLFWKISTFVIWVKILKMIIVGVAVAIGLFFPSVRECIYSCLSSKDPENEEEVLEFYVEYGETHRRLSSSQAVYQQNLLDVQNFHKVLVERLKLKQSLRKPKVPIVLNHPSEQSVTVEDTAVVLGKCEQVIDRIAVQSGWNHENVLIPIRDSLWFSLLFLLVAIYGWEERFFYEMYYAALGISWFLLQIYHYVQYVKPRQDNKTTVLITTERLIQVSSSSSENLINWWPLGNIEYGVVKGSRFNVWGHIKNEYGYLRISPGVSGVTFYSFFRGLFVKISTEKARQSKRFLYNLALRSDTKPILNLSYSGISREQLKKSWIVSNWTPVEGEKIVYTYEGVDESRCCPKSEQHSQLLISNSRFWGGITYSGGQFLIFWTGLENADGFKLRGKHVSQRNYTCETIFPCWFRKGSSSSQLSVGSFGVWPFHVVQKKGANATTGNLEDERLPGLRKIITEITLAKQKANSVKTTTNKVTKVDKQPEDIEQNGHEEKGQSVMQVV